MEPAKIRHLIDRHGASLVLYARQWCRNPDDAVQEALIALVQETPSPNDPTAWLFKVTKRKAMNLARADQRRTKHHQDAARWTDSWFDAKHDQRLIADEAERALEQLTEIERQIVVARIWGELTFEQIASLVDMSSSAVHRHFHLALDTMSALLGERTKH
ncbi:MAG: sigma-70 family RNA polymerase sigma factor [Planctomycetales bacterium]|nr:sigma-70 family RNA polymerase sigma factor [Planctomycetales bacterium]